MKEEIEKYVAEIQAAYSADPFWGGKTFEGREKHIFSVVFGGKFAKIINDSWGQKGVHCFVEIETGNILKAATWKAPAKGVRGNLKDTKRPIFGKDYYINK